MSQRPAATVNGTSAAKATRSLEDWAIAPPASGTTTVEVAQAAFTSPIAAPAPTPASAAPADASG